MNTATTTCFQHTITVTGLADSLGPIPDIADSERTDIVLLSTMAVVTTDVNGAAFPAKTSVTTKYRRLKADGTAGARVLCLHAGLGRLPSPLLEVILTECERLGVTGLREDLARLAAMRKNRN